MLGDIDKTEYYLTPGGANTSNVRKHILKDGTVIEYDKNGCITNKIRPDKTSATIKNAEDISPEDLIVKSRGVWTSHLQDCKYCLEFPDGSKEFYGSGHTLLRKVGVD